MQTNKFKIYDKEVPCLHQCFVQKVNSRYIRLAYFVNGVRHTAEYFNIDPIVPFSQTLEFGEIIGINYGECYCELSVHAK